MSIEKCTGILDNLLGIVRKCPVRTGCRRYLELDLEHPKRNEFVELKYDWNNFTCENIIPMTNENYRREDT